MQVEIPSSINDEFLNFMSGNSNFEGTDTFDNINDKVLLKTTFQKNFTKIFTIHCLRAIYHIMVFLFGEEYQTTILKLYSMISHIVPRLLKILLKGTTSYQKEGNRIEWDKQ